MRHTGIRGFASFITGIVLLGGCVTVSVRSTGAASIQDLRAEDAYVAAYTNGMTALQKDVRAFLPSGSIPGVCNKGGSKQGCFDADAAVLADLHALSASLAAAAVPPRFVEADRLLKDAIDKNVRGLELRNKALSTGDEAAWDEHRPLLDAAAQAWKDAYVAFPADHRPALAP